MMFTKHSLYLALIAFGYTLGIRAVFYAADFFLMGALPTAISLSLLVLLVFYTRKEPLAFWVFCFLLAVLIGGIRVSMVPSLLPSALETSPSKQLFVVTITKSLKNNLRQERYEGMAHKIRPSGQKGKHWIADRLAEKILVVRAKDSSRASFSLGEKVWAEGYLSTPSAPGFPGQFNYSDYLRTQGISHQLYLIRHLDLDPLKRLEGLKRKKVSYLIAHFKSKLLSKIAASPLSNQSLQVYSALVFGDKTSFDPELLSEYQNAGAVHILAISGLHIGILLALLYWLFLPLHRLRSGRLLSGLLILICLWGYAAFTGFSSSVVRAVSMFSFLSFSLLLKRPQYSLHLLVVAYFSNLIWDPLAVFSLGFAMSYAAVLSILLGMPIFNEWWSPKNKVLKNIWQLVGVSLCAQIGVLGLSLFAFHQFPLLFLLTNLMVIPFLGLVLAVGIFLALWFIWGSPPLIAVTIFDLILSQLNKVVGWVGGQEAWVLKNIYFPYSYLWGTTALVLGFTAWQYPYSKLANPWKYFLAGVVFFQCCLLVQDLSNKYKKTHYLIKSGTQTALIVLTSQELYYWSQDPLNPKTIARMKTVYPFKKIIRKPMKDAYSFGDQVLLVSAKRPNEIKRIDYLLVDEQTRALPNDFSTEQLKKTKLIFSGYAKTKWMFTWKSWAKNHERPIWKLDVHGFYTFK